MKFLDLTLPSPAENLACDEALLDWREEIAGEEILRFWESPEPLVVVGYANRIEAEVNVANCETKKMPIFRRCSGGGTVLQGRGCLNYALVLRIAENLSLAGISGTNKFIMERNREAIQPLMGGSTIRIHGHTDLAITSTTLPRPGPLPLGERESPSDSLTSGRQERPNDQPESAFRKFSGNSQRRHKNYLLFHGTFLLDFDLAQVGEFLKFPSRQPDYRNSRGHEDFITNLNLPASAVKDALRKIWKAEQPLQNPPLERFSKLAREKYATSEWNLKFFHL
jgi:lipoate---protein ligase